MTPEMIKSIIWNGGMHQLGIECGHLNDIVQWKDIHDVLISIHEARLSSAIKSTRDVQFDLDSYLSRMSADSNNDDVARFWSDMQSSESD